MSPSANTVRTPVPRTDPGATCAATLSYVSRDAPATNVDGHHEERARGKYWWVRWAVLGVVAIVLAVEVALVWDQLAKAAKSLLSAKWYWLLASASSAVVLMHSFAEVQLTLLASAGVHVQKLRQKPRTTRPTR